MATLAGVPPAASPGESWQVVGARRPLGARLPEPFVHGPRAPGALPPALCGARAGAPLRTRLAAAALFPEPGPWGAGPPSRGRPAWMLREVEPGAPGREVRLSLSLPSLARLGLGVWGGVRWVAGVHPGHCVHASGGPRLLEVPSGRPAGARRVLGGPAGKQEACLGRAFPTGLPFLVFAAALEPLQNVVELWQAEEGELLLPTQVRTPTR